MLINTDFQHILQHIDCDLKLFSLSPCAISICFSSFIPPHNSHDYIISVPVRLSVLDGEINAIKMLREKKITFQHNMTAKLVENENERKRLKIAVQPRHRGRKWQQWLNQMGK